MIDAHDPTPNPIDRDAMLRLNEQEFARSLAGFLKQTQRRFRDAQIDHDAMVGRGNDIFLVRSDESQIGKLECKRLRFAPSGFTDPSETGVGTHPAYEEVKQLIIEIPNLYNGRTPEAVFVTITGINDIEDYIVVSQKRMSLVNPRDENTEVLIGDGGKLLLCRTTESNDLGSLEDLSTPEDLSFEELTDRLAVVELLFGVVKDYKIGNQSRNDGTAA